MAISKVVERTDCAIAGRDFRAGFLPNPVTASEWSAIAPRRHRRPQLTLTGTVCRSVRPLPDVAVRHADYS